MESTVNEKKINIYVYVKESWQQQFGTILWF